MLSPNWQNELIIAKQHFEKVTFGYNTLNPVQCMRNVFAVNSQFKEVEYFADFAVAAVASQLCSLFKKNLSVDDN